MRYAVCTPPSMDHHMANIPCHGSGRAIARKAAPRIGPVQQFEPCSPHPVDMAASICRVQHASAQQATRSWSTEIKIPCTLLVGKELRDPTVFRAKVLTPTHPGSSQCRAFGVVWIGEAWGRWGLISPVHDDKLPETRFLDTFGFLSFSWTAVNLHRTWVGR